MVHFKKQLLLTCLFAGVMVSSSKDDECNTDEWQSLTSATLSPGRRIGSVLVDECDILIFGGVDGPASNPVTSVISLSTQDGNDAAWQELGAMADDMTQPWFPTTKGAFLLNDEIYVTCEDGGDGKIWNYNRLNNNWQTINENNLMPMPVEDCCAFGYNGEIYIFGGQKGSQVYDSVQIYDVSNDVWRLGESMNVARTHGACTMVNNEYVYIIGGAQSQTVLSSVEKYNLNGDSWEYFENAINPARRVFSAAYLDASNEILLIGGDTCVDPNCPSDGSNLLDTVEVWNIDNDGIDNDLSDKYPNLVTARGGLLVAVIDNNKCRGFSSDSSDDSSQSSDDDDRSVTLYAMGGEIVLDAPSYTGVETLCIEYETN